jgi:hypothetical protein
MLVGAVETIWARTTLALQILPSQKPDTAVRHPTVGIEARGTKPTRVGARTDQVASEKILDGDVEPCCLNVGLSASTLGIPASFPPGISGPGFPSERPNNPNNITTYHSVDRYYTSGLFCDPAATTQGLQVG